MEGEVKRERAERRVDKGGDLRKCRGFGRTDQ
jgi:hypothetical protein